MFTLELHLNVIQADSTDRLVMHRQYQNTYILVSVPTEAQSEM